MRLSALPFCLLLTAAVSPSFAQTFNGGGGAIPDNNNVTSYNLNVSGLSGINTNYGLEQVCININHPWDSDLEVSLRSPDGTTVVLFSGVGGDGDNFSNTCLRQNAATSIGAGSAPFSGTFRPQNDMSAFNNGQSGNGQWRLRIRDMQPGDAGTLVNWRLTFGNQPAQPMVFESSNLPIFVINTGGATIPDDPKIQAGLKIIYNGEGQRNYLTDTTYDYNGLIGIELRGSSSQGMPKKPYGFETWNPQQQDLKVSLLGMPRESDWILTANYSDKTLMRNALSYNLANKTGHYAPRTRFCELVLNGSYQGVYLFSEKIKRDSGRVDVSKLNAIDVSGAELTGGYIIKVDKFTGSGGAGWTSQVPPPNAPAGTQIRFQYVYPKPDSIQPQQGAYIKAFVDSFETALNSAGFQNPVTGWRRFMDEQSVIDYMLINEMSRNVDGYRISTFLHKEKVTKGNKLKMGPVWDYDIAWLNADYCSGNQVTGWAYNFNSVCSAGEMVPFWWQRFRQDTLFNKRLYCRYTELRNSSFRIDSLHNLVDTMAAQLAESQERNFTKWPILGTYVWPNPSPIPTTYAGEVAKLKQWISDRLAWMDNQINVYQTAPPQVQLGNDTAICQGQAVELDAGNHPSVKWNTGQTTPVIFAGDAGTYSVLVASQYGCKATDSIHISVNPIPDGNFTVTGLSNFTFSFSPSVSGAASYAWSFGDGGTSTQQSTAHTYVQAGTYTVSLTVTDANGCSATHTQTLQTQTAGLAEWEGSGLTVYPNPFTDRIFVQGEWPGGATVTIVSMDGKTVYAGYVPVNNFTVDGSTLSPGLYGLRISTADGRTVTRKLVKQ